MPVLPASAIFFSNRHVTLLLLPLLSLTPQTARERYDCGHIALDIEMDSCEYGCAEFIAEQHLLAAIPSYQVCEKIFIFVYCRIRLSQRDVRCCCLNWIIHLKRKHITIKVYWEFRAVQQQRSMDSPRHSTKPHHDPQKHKEELHYDTVERAQGPLHISYLFLRVMYARLTNLTVDRRVVPI